jgi:23S rRNA pseudouridine1911/1915/1917 synthase
MVAAKNDSAHRKLVEQIKQRKIKRRYIALVYGCIKEEKGTINAPIGRHPVNRKKMAVTDKNSKHAVTHFEVLERFKDFTLIKVFLDTGRTHQIRVHMAYIGHPVVGDPKYSKAKNDIGLDTQALHAQVLSLYHPATGEYMEFEAPIPEEFKSVLKKLLGESI